MRLNRYLPSGQDIDQICDGCRLVETKPGSQPRHLVHWIGVALDFDCLPEGSAPIYPEVLSAWEWTAVKALENARAIARAKEQRARRRDPEQNGENARLQELVNRGRR